MIKIDDRRFGWFIQFLILHEKPFKIEFQTPNKNVTVTEYDGTTEFDVTMLLVESMIRISEYANLTLEGGTVQYELY